jgi:predicted transcriptional regulator
MIRTAILERMKESGLNPNQLSEILKDRIPRRTIYDYLSGNTDARTEVASALMDVLGLTITAGPITKQGKKPGKEGKK